MVDPWGPPLKRPTGEEPIRVVTKVNAWIDAWNAIETHEWEIEGLWHESKPIYTQEQMMYLIMALDSSGSLHHIVNSSGELTEASAADILTKVNNIMNYSRQGPWSSKADGTLAGAMVGHKPIPSVVGAPTVITADGAGNIGAAADVVIAVAAETTDSWFILRVNTTGSYTTKWCEDPTGTPAPTDPDYHTAGHLAYLVAGYPYILRMINTADNLGVGYDAGVNGNWPNNAIMYIEGFTRGF